MSGLCRTGKGEAKLSDIIRTEELFINTGLLMINDSEPSDRERVG